MATPFLPADVNQLLDLAKLIVEKVPWLEAYKLVGLYGISEKTFGIRVAL